MGPLAGDFSDVSDTEKDETIFGESFCATGFTNTEDSTGEDQMERPDETMMSPKFMRKRVPSSSSSCSSEESFFLSKQRNRRTKQRVILSISDDEEHYYPNIYQVVQGPFMITCPGFSNFQTQQIQNELTFKDMVNSEYALRRIARNRGH